MRPGWFTEFDVSIQIIYINLQAAQLIILHVTECTRLRSSRQSFAAIFQEHTFSFPQLTAQFALLLISRKNAGESVERTQTILTPLSLITNHSRASPENVEIVLLSRLAQSALLLRGAYIFREMDATYQLPERSDLKV